jgi:hypothetical protein
MLDLIWGLFNFTAIIYFFYLLVGLIIKGRKSLQNQPKILSFPILIIGVSAILSSTKNQESKVNIIEQGHKMEVIQMNYSSLNKLEVILVTNNLTGDINPIFSRSSLSGFVSGRNWEHHSVDLINDKLSVTGKATYSFFGIDIFSIDQIISRT